MTVTVDKASGRAVCDVCGEKVVRREHVLGMVQRENRTIVVPANVQWRAEQVGASKMLLSRDKTVTRKVLPELRCNCDSLHGVTSSDRMLREEFRARLSGLFGENMPLTLLFQLPAAWVAWENSTLVSVVEQGGQLVLNNVGRKLNEVIVGMTMVGQLPRAPSAVDQAVVEQYTYLFMIRPEFRATVASEFGSTATVRVLFSQLSLDWFDWDAMATMRASVQGDGSVVIDKDMSMSVVQALAEQFARVKRSKPLVKGAVVSTNSVVVQAMSASMDEVHVGDHPEVSLEDGTSFLPIGHIVLHGRHKVVNFEPGISVGFPGGTVVSHPYRGVSVFVNGTVKVYLGIAGHYGEFDYHGCKLTALREHTVGVVVESYASGTLLSQWYDSKFDARSTCARFATQESDLLLLQTCAPAAVRVEPVRTRVMDVDYGDWAGSRTIRKEFDYLNYNRTYTLPVVTPSAFKRVSHELDYDLIVNGCVCVGDRGITSLCGFNFECRVLDGLDPGDKHAALTIDEVTILDEYVVDGGGPSDDEGYCDETITYVRGTLGSGTVEALVGLEKSGFDQAFPYTALVHDAVTAVRTLGKYPTLRTMLEAPGYLFDWDAVNDHTLFADRDGRLHIVKRGEQDHMWRLLAYACHVAKPLGYGGSDTFQAGLLARYAERGADPLDINMCIAYLDK